MIHFYQNNNSRSRWGIKGPHSIHRCNSNDQKTRKSVIFGSIMGSIHCIAELRAHWAETKPFEVDNPRCHRQTSSSTNPAKSAHGKLSRKSQIRKFYFFNNKMEKFEEEQDDIQFVKPRVMDDIEENEIEELVMMFVDMHFCDERPRT